MRTVEGHLLCEGKINDAISHYISTHSGSEDVGAQSLSINSSNEHGNRIVTVMHQPAFPSQSLCRQVAVSADGQITESVTGWGEDLLAGGMGGISSISNELTDDDRFAAALASVQFSQPGRPILLHDLNNVHKVGGDRNDVETTSNLIDQQQIRIYNQTTMPEQHVVVELPHTLSNSLPSLPPLKRNGDITWYQAKAEGHIKHVYKCGTDTLVLNEVGPNNCPVEVAGSSPSHIKQQSRKSLPHKKRISRKLKKGVPPEDAVGMACDQSTDEILPDSFVSEVDGSQEHLQDAETQHLSHAVRSILICQICGSFHGEDQYKFYQHLKQHYEPEEQGIIIDNAITEMPQQPARLDIEKINTACGIDNAVPLPEALVELSLSNNVTVKQQLYHTQDKDVLYGNDRNLTYTSKAPYSNSTSTTKDNGVYQSSPEKMNHLYEDLEKVPMYSCPKCDKSFRKHKMWEQHIKEMHPKLEEINEFSEPEDLMEGIHVIVDHDTEEYVNDDIPTTMPPSYLPHLTIENGHVHQGNPHNLKQWYMKSLEAANAGTSNLQEPQQRTEPLEQGPVSCSLCGQVFVVREAYLQHEIQCHMRLKDEVLQRMMAVPSDMLPQEENSTEYSKQHETSPQHETAGVATTEVKVPSPEPGGKVDKKKPEKKLVCKECGRIFRHRNSLMYHLLSHSGTKSHKCKVCDKNFYTTGALKVHARLHNGDKPYKCEVCGREFRQWGDLKNHNVSLHSNQKLHQCEFCGKKFARKYSLIIHARIHTGEKNYKCQYCTKTFRASSYLLLHTRIHTGEKPYPCEECGKPFRVKGDLRRHLLVHRKIREKSIQEKPFNKAVKTKKSKADAEQSKVPENTKLDNQTQILHVVEATKSDMEHKSSELPSLVKIEPKLEMGNKNTLRKSDAYETCLINVSKADIEITEHSVGHTESKLEQKTALIGDTLTNDSLDANGSLYLWPVYLT